MGSFQIRRAVPDKDYEQLGVLLSQMWPDTISAETLQEWDEMDKNDLNRRMVLVDSADVVVGYSSVHQSQWSENGRFHLWVCVAPTYRKNGLGAKLYDEAFQFVQGQSAALLDTEVREDNPESLQFAEKRSFVFDRHLFESTINLETFDRLKFKELWQVLDPSSMRISTLAMEGDDEESRRKLHAVNKATALADPASQGTFPDFDSFDKMWNTASWFVPEGQFIAIDGDEYVGLSAVGYFKDSNSMYNMMTGVDERYRGQKIAQVLKLHSIQFAKEFGADFIRTNNDSLNAPMLAINRKLGYEPQPGEYRLKLVL